MPSGRRAASQPDVLGKRDSYSCLTFLRSSGLYSVCTSLRARPTRSCFSPLLLRPIEASSVCRSETRKLLTMFCNKDKTKIQQSEMVSFIIIIIILINIKAHTCSEEYYICDTSTLCCLFYSEIILYHNYLLLHCVYMLTVLILSVCHIITKEA